MMEQLVFHPPRRRGILFQSTLILVLGGSSALAFLFGLNQPAAAYFVLFLLLSLLLFAPLPWVVYRLYALSRASYRLERDGLRLRWGMRAEDIPLPEVEWVRRYTELAGNLPLPRLHWPGAMLGKVKVADLGDVEYIAAETRSLLFIATSRRVYAISPRDPEEFLHLFQRSLEMGSLTPISSVSVLPAAYLSKLWTDVYARVLLLASLVCTLLLFVSVSLAIPMHTSVSLGFYPNGAPLPSGPAAQLLLLPILVAFIFLVDLPSGLFFYRRQNERLIAYAIWSGGLLATLLFGAAALIILLHAA